MIAHPSHPMFSSTCAISISRSPFPMLLQTGPVLTPSQKSWFFASQSKAIWRKLGVGICIRCEAVPPQQVDDGYYMRRCVDIARKGMGHTSPNPMVGCVIVKGGTIVGEGFHPKAGQPHAEVFALRNAGDLAESATAYVSLEPCNHFGRTPPCTEALIKSKVKKVVVGMVDPNPIVASKGIDRLRDAGIDVTVGIEEGLCKKLNEAYIHTMLTGKPFGALRYSLSMNGCLLDRLGEGVSATGGYFSRLLNEYDAVISFPISSADQVLFLASQEPGASQPFQILVARNPCPPIQIPVPANESTSKVIIFTDNPAAVAPEISQRGMEVVVSDLLNLDVIMEYCMRRGLCSVVLDLRGTFSDFKDLVDEGIGQNLVQKIIVEVLPVWDGSESGGSSFSALESIGRRQVKDMALSAVISGRSAVLEGYLG